MIAVYLKPQPAIAQEPFDGPFRSKKPHATINPSMTDHELFVVHCTADNGWLLGDIWDDATSLILR